MKRRSIGPAALLGSALLAQACCVQASEGADRRRGLAIDSLMAWTYVADPRMSPDEQAIAYVVSRPKADAEGYDNDIRVISTAGAQRTLIAGPSDERLPRWSADGRRLAFLSNRTGVFQVFVVAASGGELQQLTRSAADIASFEWAPDGSQIAYTAREASPSKRDVVWVSERLVYRKDGAPGFRPAQPTQIWTVSAGSGDSQAGRQITRDNFDHDAPVWSADGRRIYFSANDKADADAHPSDTEIFSVAADGSEPAQAITTRRGPAAMPRVSPDGRWLAYIGYDETDPPAAYVPPALYLLSLDDPSSTPVRIDHPRGVGDGVLADSSAPKLAGERFAWSPDSRWIHFISASEGSVHLYRVSPARRQVEQVSRHAAGEVREFTVGRSGLVAAVFATSMQPAEIGLISTSARDRSVRTITQDAQRPLQSVALATVEERWCTSFDGTKIQYWHMLPPGFERGRRYPTMLYVHGGPDAMYGASFFHEFQVLAARGIAVLFGNPRGSSGYGASFGNAIQGRYPGDDYRDLMAIVDDALRTDSVDPYRLAIGGGSGGGLLTGWAIGKTHRFAAAVVERAVTDWYSMVGASDLGAPFIASHFSTLPWLDPSEYHARSPISLVANVRTPVLVLHNEQDYRTSLDQGLQYYTALQMLGKPAKLAVFPNSSHGMSRDGTPAQRMARLRLIADWLDQHLGGAR